MRAITLRKLGNSLGFILPKESLAQLNVQEGDQLFLTVGPDGLRLTPFDPEFELKMRSAKAAIRKYRNALRELAK